MKKYLSAPFSKAQCCLLILLLITFSVSLFSQTQPSTASASREDRFAKFESVMVYPLIKGTKMAGIIPV